MKNNETPLKNAPTGLRCEVFSVRFSPNDAFLAAGCGRGTVCIYNVSTHQEHQGSYRAKTNGKN